VRPDWWKLPPSENPQVWRAIQDTIAREDPLCRGVLVLGLSAPESEIVTAFAAAAPFEVVKGFAIGRTVFHEAARDWFSGAVDDSQASAAMAAKFSTLAAAWRGARAALAK
jgi:5-dehydro-2-deoxygluconokinase